MTLSSAFRDCAPFVCLLLASCFGRDMAVWPNDVTRKQAAGQFTCYEQDIDIRELGNSEVQATGCGKTATWSCSGNTDGHDVIEILDHRCHRISEITSQWGTAAKSTDSDAGASR